MSDKILGDDDWRRFAEMHGGEYQSGGLFRHGSASIPRQDTEIHLDSQYTQHFAGGPRLWTAVENPNRLRFRIFRRHFMSSLLKLSAAEETLSGNAFFDDRIAVISNKPGPVQRLLDDSELRNLILSLLIYDDAAFVLGIEDGSDLDLGLSLDTDVLMSRWQSSPQNLSVLSTLYSVHTATLDRFNALKGGTVSHTTD